jgi:repressor LexA
MTKTETLTKRQKQLLEYVVQYTFENLFQPSVREIGEHMGITSTNGVSDHLKAIQRKGYIVISDPPTARAIVFRDAALCLVKSSDYLRARPIILPRDVLVKL